jgi:hypothetical protein
MIVKITWRPKVRKEEEERELLQQATTNAVIVTYAVEDVSLNEGRINHRYVCTLPEVHSKWTKKFRPQ